MNAQVLRTLLGQELRRLRESQDLSLHRLADMCGSSYTHLWKIENAKVSAGVDTLNRISEALDVPLNAIFDAVYATYGELYEA